MIADVPLGAFLSGGVDSSAVVAMMAGLEAAPVSTFSIAFGTRGLTNSAYAAAIAERYGHRPSPPSGRSQFLRPGRSTGGDLRRAVRRQLGDANLAGLRHGARKRNGGLVGRWRRRSVCRLPPLSLACVEERVRRLLPAGIARSVLFGALGRLYPKLDWAPRPLRAKATLQELARDPAAAYFSSVSVCGDELRRRLFSPALHRRAARLQRCRTAARTHGAVRQRGSAVAGSIRRYQDLSAGRYPDQSGSGEHGRLRSKCVCRCSTIPWSNGRLACRRALKLRGGEGKYVFKSALEPYVPPEILYRPETGFAVPLASWFRGPLRQRLRETFCGSAFCELGLFDVAAIATLLDQHQSGERDHSAALWTLSMFESFLRRIRERAHFRVNCTTAGSHLSPDSVLCRLGTNLCASASGTRTWRPTAWTGTGERRGLAAAVARRCRGELLAHIASRGEPIAMDVRETRQWRSGAADRGGFQKMEVRIAVLETVGNAIVIAYDGRPVLTTDPWIEGDAYFGSWAHNYEIPPAQLQAIRDAQYHWFSHGHPDHLNIASLPMLTRGQFLLSDHYGNRIRRDLTAAGYGVRVLPDREWT